MRSGGTNKPLTGSQTCLETDQVYQIHQHKEPSIMSLFASY